MRRHLFFISTIVLLLGSVFYFWSTLKAPQLLGFQNSQQAVQIFLKNFKKTHQPITEINLANMYHGNGQLQILHPDFTLRSLSFNLPAPVCSPAELESKHERPDLNKCNMSKTTPTEIFNPFQKASAKHQQYLKILGTRHADPDFLVTPPFLTESGDSYAYLLFKENIEPISNRHWIENHLSFFRTIELKNILKHFSFYKPDYEVLSRLSEQEIKLLVEGSAALLTPDYFLIKNESRLGFSPLSYWAYNLRDLRAQLQHEDYDLVTYLPTTHCLEKIGNTCWTYNSQTALAYLYKNSLSIIAFAAIAFLALISFYWNYIAAKNREQKKSQLALQVLSHEFRTPVSAMLLLIDELAKNQNQMSDENQDKITKFSAETYRLQRIIEMSMTYLQSTSTQKQFSFVVIDSINAWIDELASDFAHDYDSKVYCELLALDQSVIADIFWLRFALSNLVQNAMAHGKHPVFIRLTKNKNGIIFSVEDGGSCEFKDLNVMTEAFVKENRSSGMGLGLNITSTIVREWGGQLKFKQFPTTFSIVLNQKLER